MNTKIKWTDGFWLGTAILLLSFGILLYQLIVLETQKGSEITFNDFDQAQIIKANSNPKSDFKTVVASKIGQFYYYPSCSKAQNIKYSNKIWFKSVELAEQAGYEPATGCLPQK